MARWMKTTAIFAVTLTFVIVGVGVGLFLIENNRWQPVELHAWLRAALAWLPWDVAGAEWEVWLPTLMAGWLVAVLALGALFLWSVFYVWRVRQHHSERRRLERELIKLRNLPFEEPAPFEDESEAPDPGVALLLARLETDRLADDVGARGPGAADVGAKAG